MEQRQFLSSRVSPLTTSAAIRRAPEAFVRQLRMRTVGDSPHLQAHALRILEAARELRKLRDEIERLMLDKVRQISTRNVRNRE